MHAASATQEEDAEIKRMEAAVEAARKKMVDRSQNMVNVNDDAQKAMIEHQRLIKVASDEFTEAIHELDEAESYKAESCIHFQFLQHKRSLATATGEGHEEDGDNNISAQFEKQFEVSQAMVQKHLDIVPKTAEKHGAAAAAQSKKARRGNPT